jgi:hypothetical protein
MNPAEAVQRVQSQFHDIAKVGRSQRAAMLADREQKADSWRRADIEEIDRKREGEG